MLKDKSCYANEAAYANQYYHHMAGVKDFPIDPLLGSFIRVLTPPENQPEGVNAAFKHPQFMFMTRTDRSRMIDRKEARTLFDAVCMIIKEEKTECPTRLSMVLGNVLETDQHGNINFKDLEGGMISLVSCPPRPRVDRGINEQMLTRGRYLQCLYKLHNGLQYALMGEPQETIQIGNVEERITRIGDELMFTMKRPDQRVSKPVVVTSRCFPNRKDHYIILHSDNQRIIFPTAGAKKRFYAYFDTIIEMGESLTEVGDMNQNAYQFINGGPDEWMEYVSLRKVDFVGGPQVHVIMNSDRYPGNSKFTFIYDFEFVKELRNRLIELVDQIEIIQNEQANSSNTADA